MHESKQHAALDHAFAESGEEYHMHSMMKPRFEDFKLQFEGLHSQVADSMPLAEKQQEDAMPYQLRTGSLPIQGAQTKSYIPTQPRRTMSSPMSPVQRTEVESPLSLDVMSKPLEDPSIHDRQRV